MGGDLSPCGAAGGHDEPSTGRPRNSARDVAQGGQSWGSRGCRNFKQELGTFKYGCIESKVMETADVQDSRAWGTGKTIQHSDALCACTFQLSFQSWNFYGLGMTRCNLRCQERIYDLARRELERDVPATAVTWPQMIATLSATEVMNTHVYANNLKKFLSNASAYSL